ncbi:uncharacterized protein B0I36DRAFT_346166 [Microdochium trichocladiopsis]|uniref:Uncharacterized protein n=1 Tax=Microdochium trichocladiopsis TaxID=1682393 RepID=A0A9P9BYL1_9PEZI|nr:uncharacterized protein B0I36DRAFT_346166 [Microdochium trichocladiopsis]KAH7038158.1 hypothetical protein B0I36DRAFT_346166 [Microdochium trichocladiopsis]
MATEKRDPLGDVRAIVEAAAARRSRARRFGMLGLGIALTMTLFLAASLSQLSFDKLVSSVCMSGNHQPNLDVTGTMGGLGRRQVYEVTDIQAAVLQPTATGLALGNMTNGAIETSTAWAVVTVTHTPGNLNMTALSTTKSVLSNTTITEDADTTIIVTATVFPEQPTEPASSSVSATHTDADVTVIVTATVFPEASSSTVQASTSSSDAGADVTVTVTATVMPEPPAGTTSLAQSSTTTFLPSSPCSDEMATTSSASVLTSHAPTSKLTWSLSLSDWTNTTVCHGPASSMLNAVSNPATSTPGSSTVLLSFVSSVDPITASSPKSESPDNLTVTVTQRPATSATHVTVTTTGSPLSPGSSSASIKPSSLPASVASTFETLAHTTISTTDHLTSTVATITRTATETDTLLPGHATSADAFSAVTVPTDGPEQCATAGVFTETTVVTSTVIFVTGPTAIPTATVTVTAFPGISSVLTRPTTDCTDTGLVTVTVTAGTVSSAYFASSADAIQTTASTDGIAVSQPAPSPNSSSSSTTPDSGFSTGLWTPLLPSVLTSTILTTPVPLTPTSLPTSMSSSSSSNISSNTTVSIPLVPLLPPTTTTTGIVVISDAGASSTKNLPRVTTYWGGSNGIGSATCVVMLVATVNLWLL